MGTKTAFSQGKKKKGESNETALYKKKSRRIVLACQKGRGQV